jgi:hypothetical protein
LWSRPIDPAPVVSREHPKRAVVPGLRLAQERGPKDQRYLGLGLAQFFGKTQPQRYVVDGLPGSRIDHERGDLFVRPTHASQDRHHAPLLLGRLSLEPTVQAIIRPISKKPDQMLIESVAGGDKQALEQLFARYSTHIYDFVLRITGNAGLSDDVVSEVFLEALSGPVCAPGQWLAGLKALS